MLLKRVRVLAAAIESAIGTAETLDGGDAAFNAYDVMAQNNITLQEREGQGGFDRLAAVPGGYEGTITFKTDIHYNGTDIPTWASVLFPACGWVDNSGTFSPKNEAPGSNVKTATIAVYQNGRIKKLAGAVGSFRVILPTGQMGHIEWTFRGVWQPVADGSILTPTYPTTLPSRFASGVCTYNSVNLKVSNVTIDSGNEIVMREDAAKDAGFISGIVVDRYPKITLDPESVLVATQDRFGFLLSMVEYAFVATLDGAGGGTVSFQADKAQVLNNQEADRGKLEIDQIELGCNKNGTSHEQSMEVIFTPAA